MKKILFNVIIATLVLTSSSLFADDYEFESIQDYYEEFTLAKIAEVFGDKPIDDLFLFDTLFVEVKDGFGDIKTKEICQVQLNANSKKHAFYYALLWHRPDLLKLEGVSADNDSERFMRRSAVSSFFERYGPLNLNTLALQAKELKLESSLSSDAIFMGVDNFVIDKPVKTKHIQLIQAYFAANNLLQAGEWCRYFPNTTQDVSVDIFRSLMAQKDTNPAAYKLLLILNTNISEKEKIDLIMKQPRVKEMFQIISKATPKEIVINLIWYEWNLMAFLGEDGIFVKEKKKR